MFNYIVDSAAERGTGSRFPEEWRPRLANAFYLKEKSNGYAEAKNDLLSNLEKIDGGAFDLASSDDEICEFARGRANQCLRTYGMFRDKAEAFKQLVKVTLRYGITLPSTRNVTKNGLIQRCLNEHFWRRGLRKVIARNVEAAAINIGLVSRVAGLYVSDEAVKRRRGQRNRNNRILSGIIATNDKGESFTMQDLSDLGISNPKLRRMELMTRIAGFDAIAQVKDHAAEFYTLTAPSKYHARHHVTGKVNPKYNGATPRETQKYLTDLWQLIRSKLAREEIYIYGFRIVEPHHDATPHWHALFFTDKANVKRLRDIMRSYALAEDGNEAGAAKHRFKAEPIDRSKGSAVSYLAKYISKNIDGHGVGEDFEAIDMDTVESSERVDAWASTWGIRQFQQIGGHSVTLWRELRRADIETIENEHLQNIALAADAGGWDKFNDLNGGVLAEIKKVGLFKIGAVDLETGEVSLNQYGEVAAEKVGGFTGFGETILTHEAVWIFERVGEAVTPRSPVNNCTDSEQLASIEKSAADFREKRIKNEPEPFCFIDFNAKNIYQLAEKRKKERFAHGK